MASELVSLFSQKMEITTKMKINSLPNEMLRAVLEKVDEEDVQKLIPIRAVCKRWLLVIEDICHDKKSLVIGSNDGLLVDLSYLNYCFNGLVDLNKKNCVILEGKPEIRNKIRNPILLTNHFSTLSARLFPKVENLFFDEYFDFSAENTENLIALLKQYSSTITTLLLPPSSNFPESHLMELYDQLDKLTELKKLLFSDVDALKPATLAKLEHCSLRNCDIHKVVPHLSATNCTSLYLFGQISREKITQMAELNPQLMARLKHVRLNCIEENEVLPFVCAKSAQLQYLNIGFENHRRIFTDDMFAHLNRLPNLSTLSIDSFWLDLSALVNFNLKFNSVKILTISRFNFQRDFQMLIQHGGPIRFDGDKFCRVLSNIFPGIVQLTIKHEDPLIRAAIGEHLDRFVNLRKHVIVPSY